MMTINEALQSEAIAHRLCLTRYELNVAGKMLRVLNDADAELSARLLIALEELPRGNFTTDRIVSMLDSVRELNREFIGTWYSSLTDELLAFSEYESGYQYSLFNALLPDAVRQKYPLFSITSQQVYAAATAEPFQGRLLKDWADNLEADRITRIANAVRNGFLLGDTNEQIVRNVRGTKARGYKDGALEASRRNASAVVRTAVSHTAAVARDEFAAQNSDYIKGKKWLSTLDTRTTEQCVIRDGKRYTMDGKPVGHRIPYGAGPGRLHWCCRSTETLITKSWREMGIDIDEMPPGTRASMDGQVPADTTYLEWLKNQSAARQDEILGPTRAKLMRDGGMAPESFYTDKGKFLTIEQLKKLDAKAFEEAGL
ncbi:phage minor head protein [Leminorella grimontii]|nr:phage minor head protein [Leminorella grimontii]VFS60093.1 phage head morphogenesis protein, SPP1 gp7 family [Leminorella grimontii]